MNMWYLYLVLVRKTHPTYLCQKMFALNPHVARNMQRRHHFPKKNVALIGGGCAMFMSFSARVLNITCMVLE